jgi:ribosomal RNA-processing protein 8
MYRVKQVPLEDGVLDCVVFCLSLMGTNYGEFIKEAYRVLRMNGVLVIAEIKSRFSDLHLFKQVMCENGFRCIKLKTCKDYFWIGVFIKIKRTKSVKFPALKPSTYKKR